MSEIFIPKLEPKNFTFPDPKYAGDIVAWGGDLDPKRVINAYKCGIFPWFSKGDPLLWWSPNERYVLFLDDIRVSKSLKRSLRKFQVTFNKNFHQVITMCKRVREDIGEETWLVDEMISAYEKLHERGYAHSVEVWSDDELVGGLYGICIGKMFCGESMFHTKSDASKVALVSLVNTLKMANFELVDCQVSNPHLISLGATCIPKEEFLQILKNAINRPSELKL